MKIKTIDINAFEWFDKIAGNSYFAGYVTINYGMKSEKTVNMPFQYGYGEQYRHAAFEALENAGIIKDREKHANGSKDAPHTYCSVHGIVLRAHKTNNQRKRDLMRFNN